jgi:PadR family transcriptional regulator PadR
MGVRLSRVTPATLDVLEALMGPDEELYGLKIAQNAGRKAGSVYPILARLEEAGWVESSWEREERGERGPRRRFYRLVPDGLAAARALLAERRGGVRQRTGRAIPAGRPDPVTDLVFLRRVAQ